MQSLPADPAGQASGELLSRHGRAGRGTAAGEGGGRRDPRRRQVEILYAGGWTNPREIQQLMARDGSKPPHLLTIRRWTDPEFEARMRRHSRNCMRRKRATARLDRLTEVEMWELALEVTR
jgi:hypothetical protein